LSISYKDFLIICCLFILSVFFCPSSFRHTSFSNFQGSGKTHAFRQLEKAIVKTEKMFPATYLKPVVVNGKPTESDLSSIITHTNHIGLRQHLSSNNKILLNDDADLIAESYGLYNVNDYTKEHERNIILCGYDG
jgi:hypothetical protein